MSDDKPWYLSRGAVANVLGVFLSLLVTFGIIDVDGAGQDALINQGADLWLGIGGVVISAIGLWGRIKATKSLTLT